MLKVGNKVRVVRNATDDASDVAGKVGRVVRVDSNGDALVSFAGWNGGHDGGKGDGNLRHWYVDRKNLRPVTAKRKKA
jgi:hypothetical protein